jgi:hypothetical protein
LLTQVRRQPVTVVLAIPLAVAGDDQALAGKDAGTAAGGAAV